MRDAAAFATGAYLAGLVYFGMGDRPWIALLYLLLAAGHAFIWLALFLRRSPKRPTPPAP